MQANTTDNLKNIERLINIFKSLRGYQKKGVKFLIECDSVLLADEMGLGKTVQAAVALEILKRIYKSIKVLIICPSSLCINWDRELNKWAPKLSIRRIFGNANDRKAHFRLPFNVWIASYEQIRNEIDFILGELNFDLVVLDEAQRIKNSNSITSMVCRQLPRKKAWALTGTPIENNLGELISLFNFLKPGVLYMGMPRKNVHERMSKFFLRRIKKDVLQELPPIIIQDLELEMERNQLETYENQLITARSVIRESKAKISNIDLLALITKLKQICNYDPISGNSCKINALKDIINGQEGSKYKIIVFSQYVKTLNEIEKQLNSSYTICYHGGLSKDLRESIINNFKESKKSIILLMSLKAGGVGLNLPNASMVILFDRWWNPAVEDQAIQRAHRFGREEPLQVIRMLVENSIEERIDKILKEKRLIFNEYIDKAKIADVSSFTKEDLIKILGISPFNN